jgi:ATP-dependent DNA helicase RecG
MRSISEIQDLLNELGHTPANDLEDQDLDFKEWNLRSIKDSIASVVDMAICMANGGGGTIIFGINDKAIGREKSILGVSPEVDVNRLKKAVYDSTDPKLTPVFEELVVPEGSGRLLVMQIYPGIPPYTDTAGKGKVRIGKDCQPLTGTLRRKIAIETGETDFTGETVQGRISDLISASAMEQLRTLARKENAPADLLAQTNEDLLSVLQLIRAGKLTWAGLLIAGKPEAMKDCFPGYVWTFLRMRKDTEYVDRADGHDPIPIALQRLEELINLDNPITTVEQGFYHFEYRVYPSIALREVLLNAFCHADYRIHGPILVKHFKSRLEFSNPGGFIAGITPDNILHHQPAARNPLLVDAMVRLRLVNRGNLGISRMFDAFLIEGKDPPAIEEVGESVRITFHALPLSATLRMFTAIAQKDSPFNTDELLILRHLLRFGTIDIAAACDLCQRRKEEAVRILAGLEHRAILTKWGEGLLSVWRFTLSVSQRLAPEIAVGDVKAQILRVMKAQSSKGLKNAQIQEISGSSRSQVKRIMNVLQKQGLVRLEGKGQAARWIYASSQ